MSVRKGWFVCFPFPDVLVVVVLCRVSGPERLVAPSSIDLCIYKHTRIQTAAGMGIYLSKHTYTSSSSSLKHIFSLKKKQKQKKLYIKKDTAAA